MLIKILRRLMASKGAHKLNNAVDIVLDFGHENLIRNQLRYLGVGPAVALQ
jgi:hypothetical protein